MRMMLRWTVPAEKGNAMINDGSMGRVIEAVMEKTNPEAAYFLAQDGKRSGMVFFDMKESTDIPRIAEILFQGFGAFEACRLALGYSERFVQKGKSHSLP